MRIDRLHIQKYKNLTDFNIDLDERHLYTILLGQNASGKSNFLEALVVIFRDLELEKDPQFKYEIEYIRSGISIKIEADPDSNPKYKFVVKDKALSKKQFFSSKAKYLPKYVFAYYSGPSNRLESNFDVHQNLFYRELLEGNDEPLRPLFYARLIHSHFVLMAFYSFPDSQSKEFLKKYLNIIGLESILFVLKQPSWNGSKSKGDNRFWWARGVVKNFLSNLWDISIAPIRNTEKLKLDFRGKLESTELLYLYISSEEKLKRLAKLYSDNVNFFKVLESTYISDLIQEIRIRVKKANVNQDITFKELSEGEQQLLTVLGLLKFTKDEESLILLDEPDTHLNPLWKWKYISLLEDVVHKPESTQIIMCTHDPLVIGGLKKEEIRVFYDDPKQKKIVTFEPSFDPKGLGVAGILTSDLFDLPTTLDPESQKDIIELRMLRNKQVHKTINSSEQKRLNDLVTQYEQLGITTTHIDPLYERFLNLAMSRKEFQKPALTKEEKENLDKLASEIFEEIMQKEPK